MLNNDTKSQNKGNGKGYHISTRLFIFYWDSNWFFFQIGSYYLNSGGEGRPTLQNFGADSVTQNIVFWLYNNHHRFIECKIKNMWAQNSVRFFIISYYFYISCT